jgi:hypothetical protein
MRLLRVHYPSGVLLMTKQAFVALGKLLLAVAKDPPITASAREAYLQQARDIPGIDSKYLEAVHVALQ